MRRILLLAILAGLAGCGMNAKIRRMEPREQDHYYALKVWMDEGQRKEFLKQKTPELRDQWLKDNALWDRFYQYDEDTRKAIVAGDVKVGWKQEEVFMAWGEPVDRSRLPGRPAQRSELFTYRFEIDADGNTVVWRPDSNLTYKAAKLYRVEVIVDDLVVTEINMKDGWED
jgi:hypothetical protein